MTRTRKRTKQEQELMSLGGFSIHNCSEDVTYSEIESERNDWIDSLEYYLDYRHVQRAFHPRLNPGLKTAIDLCYLKIAELTKKLEDLDS